MFINSFAWEKFLACPKKLISYTSSWVASCLAVRLWVKNTQRIAEMTVLYIKDVWGYSLFFATTINSVLFPSAYSYCTKYIFN